MIQPRGGGTYAANELHVLGFDAALVRRMLDYADGVIECLHLRSQQQTAAHQAPAPHHVHAAT